MTRKLALIGVPSSAVAYAPGQEKAPAAFRDAGLIEMLHEKSITVEDYGDTAGFRWRADKANPRAMNLEQVVKAARTTAEKVTSAFSAGAAALILGGDCTVELGSVSGALAASNSVGLIYFDLDTDLNTPKSTTDGALDWMGVAHMLGVEGAAPELARIGPRFPLLPPDSVYLLARKNVKPPEQALIDGLAIEGVGADRVAADPEGCARAVLHWGSRFDRLLIHLDVDVIDFENFPIAEHTRRKMGLSLEQVMTALTALLQAPNWTALTITEVNPDHGLADGATIREFAGAISSALATAPALR
jgi:arginase